MDVRQLLVATSMAVLVVTPVFLLVVVVLMNVRSDGVVDFVFLWRLHLSW